MSSIGLPENLKYQRPVVIANPVSSRAGYVTAALENMGVRPFVIPTQRDLADTRDIICEKLETGDLPIVDGGDGTVSQVVNALMSDDSRRLGLDRIPMRFWGGGYANDFASQLNGNRSFLELLEATEHRIVYPLRFSVRHEDSVILDMYAAAYAGGGGVADAAAAVDRLKQAPRPLRLPVVRKVAAALICWHVDAREPRFSVTDMATGDSQQATDIIWANGNRMAIDGKLAARLDRPDMSLTVKDMPGHVRSLLGMLALQRGGLPATRYTEHTMQIVTRRGQDFAVHLDGDRRFIPSGSLITASYERDGFTAVAPVLARSAS